MACEEADTAYSLQRTFARATPPPSSHSFFLTFLCYLFRLSREHAISQGLSLGEVSCQMYAVSTSSQAIIQSLV